MSSSKLKGSPVSSATENMESDAYSVAEILEESGWNTAIEISPDRATVTIRPLPRGSSVRWERIKNARKGIPRFG